MAKTHYSMIYKPVLLNSFSTDEIIEVGSFLGDIACTEIAN